MSSPDLEVSMRTLAATTSSATPLPDADLIWRRAATLARWRQYEVAMRPIRVAERVACIVCSVTGMAALVVLRPGIEAALQGMDQTLVRLLGMTLAATAAVTLVLVKALSAEE